MRTRYSILYRLIFGASLSLIIPQHSNAADAQVQHSAPVLEAMWHAQDLRFRFTSTTTHYSCDELGRRVVAILRALGAREGMAVQAQCSANFSGHGDLDVKLAMPVEATSANLERETTFDAKEQLVARVHKQPLPSVADVERFPAIRRQVVLTKNRALDIQYNDCDLLRGMRRQLFPQLDIRVVRRSFRCDPQPSHIRPRIIVEALLPVAGVG
jgi:hypothetical protein